MLKHKKLLSFVILIFVFNMRNVISGNDIYYFEVLYERFLWKTILLQYFFKQYILSVGNTIIEVFLYCFIILQTKYKY